MNQRRCRAITLTLGLVTLGLLHAALAPAGAHDAQSTGTHDHAAHRHEPRTTLAGKGERYRRTFGHYVVPDVTLVDQDGKRVRFQSVVDSGKPVLLNFIFTTCTTVCPPMAAGFARVQQALGGEAADVTLVSVSIDPDHDTPAVMRTYLGRFGARPGWDLLTGKPEDVSRIMKAFDAYVTNKMSHSPLTFLRAPGSGTWVRIDGLLGTSDLVAEYRTVASASPAPRPAREP